ncbi:MAG: hypothetical protein AAFO69_19530, partial [Bacteroidota bacterium]
VVGDWYYISVDSRQDTPGTFTLCTESFQSYDLQKNALELSGRTYCSPNAAFNLMGAGMEPGLSTYGYPADVWFTFVAEDVAVKIDLKVAENEGDLQRGALQLLGANSASAEVVEIPWNNSNTIGASLVFANLLVGNQYKIRVLGNNTTSSSFTLCYEQFHYNDFQENAAVLRLPNSGGCYPEDTFDFTYATNDRIHPLSLSHSNHKDLWYQFTPTREGVYFEANGAYNRYDNHMALLDEAGNVIATSDDYPKNDANLLGVVSNQLVPGDLYYLFVSSRRESSLPICARHFEVHDFDNPLVINTEADLCSDTNYLNTVASPAVPGQPQGSRSPDYAWVKLRANERAMKITAPGSDIYAGLSIFDEQGTELTSAYSFNVQYSGLTVGEWYYLAFSGQFEVTPCITFLPFNDTPETAYDITSSVSRSYHLSTGYGGDNDLRPFYTVKEATPDRDRPSNWSEGPNQNVWFRFTANNSDGTIYYFLKDRNDLSNAIGDPMIALYEVDDDDLEEIVSVDYPDSPNNFTSSRNHLIFSDLTPGQEYF